jgi:hypothetical protein
MRPALSAGKNAFRPLSGVAMTDAEWRACYEPDDLLEQVRDHPPYDRLWRYVLLNLLGIGADQAADLVECRRTGNLGDQTLHAHQLTFRAQARRTTGGGYSAGRKPVRVPVATQQARAAAAALQPDVRQAAAAVTRETRHLLQREQCGWLRCLFPNPSLPTVLDPSWLTSIVLALAAGIDADQAFDRLPILADALQDVGCGHAPVLDHCRAKGAHVRGCWVIDWVLSSA